MGRWLIGLIALLLVGLVYGLLTAGPRIEAMEGDIRDALRDGGHSWANVEMDGNVATLTGSAPDAAARANALEIAENAKCSACNDKHRWHSVRDGMNVTQVASAYTSDANMAGTAPSSSTTTAVIPIQAPYTFSARKLADGRVVLSGYVPNEATRVNVLERAERVFDGSTIVDDGIKVARGEPNARWGNAINSHFRELNLLTEGRLELDGDNGAVTGIAPDQGVQAQVLAMSEEDRVEGYTFATNIRVPGAATRQSGEVQSQAICQTLLDDLREGKKVLFEQSKSDIRGDANFDLLNEISAAANQCQQFRISINGYTSSEGDEAFNQALSESRANAVLAYLNGEGNIDRARLSATGYGEANPVASNDTAEGREANRRIEFILSRSE